MEGSSVTERVPTENVSLICNQTDTLHAQLALPTHSWDTMRAQDVCAQDARATTLSSSPRRQQPQSLTTK